METESKTSQQVLIDIYNKTTGRGRSGTTFTNGAGHNPMSKPPEEGEDNHFILKRSVEPCVGSAGLPARGNLMASLVTDLAL